MFVIDNRFRIFLLQQRHRRSAGSKMRTCADSHSPMTLLTSSTGTGGRERLPRGTRGLRGITPVEPKQVSLMQSQCRFD
jgi:hypothetical protein